MYLEGIKLMVIGMSTVAVFILVMIILISLVARLTRQSAIQELEIIDQERKERALAAAKKRAKPVSDGPPVEVISAAIAAFKADQS